MITLEYLQETAQRNVAVEEHLGHIIDIMVDCGVADFIPTDIISRWRYAPERSCVIAEKEYKDSYDPFGDLWESYSIPVECFEMSDEELETLFSAEYEMRQKMELENAKRQLERDADYLGYTLVAKETCDSIEEQQKECFGFSMGRINMDKYLNGEEST